MEAEVLALAHTFWERFPIMNTVSLLGRKVCLPVGEAIMNVLAHEDSAKALVLARLSNHSSHIVASINPSRWFGFEFWEQIVLKGMKLVKIYTME